MSKLINITRSSGGFSYEVTPKGNKCHFLKFLINTSDFSWKVPDSAKTSFHQDKKAFNLVTKLCAIGYLLQPIKLETDVRAVIAVNGIKEWSPFGTGKSLFAEVLKSMVSNVTLNGRNRYLTINRFIYQHVNEGTRLIIIDDSSRQTDFLFFADACSGDLRIDKQAQNTTSIPHYLSPKFLFTQEAPFADQGASASNRQWYIQFSDYYNGLRSPENEFGHQFIKDWNQEDYALLNQLFVECMQIYLEFGIQEANVKHLIQE